MSSMTHESQYDPKLKRVHFTGSTALYKGMIVCYDRDTGTAANAVGYRDKYVELPSQSNNRWVAGVVDQDYPAKTGGQEIVINEPDGICEIATLIATVVASTRLTGLAGAGGAGYFAQAGFQGRGSALALQTLTAIASPTDYNVGVISSSLDGSATIGAGDKVLTKTAAFANVPATANLQGNEYVHIVGGSVTSGGTLEVTTGRYRIVSKTSDDAVVLDSSPCASASSCAFYCVRGTPTVLAKLDDGPESGLVEWVTPDSATAKASMVGGLSLIFGGHTITTDSTYTLADGTILGEWKAFKLMGALTTNDYLVTVTSGEQLDGSTDLASLEFDGAADMSVLQWGGIKWRLMHNAGTGLA